MGTGKLNAGDNRDGLASDQIASLIGHLAGRQGLRNYFCLRRVLEEFPFIFKSQI